MPADKVRAAADQGRDGDAVRRPHWQGIGCWMVAALGLTGRIAAEEPVTAPVVAKTLAAKAADRVEQPREKRILLFTASWCGPCQAIKGDLKNPERTPDAACAKLRQTGWKVGPEATNHIQVIDVGESSDLSERFKVQSLPTLVLIENGREVRRIEGATDAWMIGKLYKGYDERLSRHEPRTGSDVAGS